MQHFDFNKYPIVPPHCLVAAGLLLVSGCRAESGLPRLQAARRPAGNCPTVGGKAPDAWGASGADSVRELAAEAASRWEGWIYPEATTAQLHRESASLLAPQFLLHLAGLSPHLAVPAGKVATWSDRGHREEIADAGKDDRGEKKIVFIPKPDPWNGNAGGAGMILKRSAPDSFCGRAVTFTPTPNPRR